MPDNGTAKESASSDCVAFTRYHSGLDSSSDEDEDNFVEKGQPSGQNNHQVYFQKCFYPLWFAFSLSLWFLVTRNEKNPLLFENTNMTISNVSNTSTSNAENDTAFEQYFEPLVRNSPSVFFGLPEMFVHLSYIKPLEDLLQKLGNCCSHSAVAENKLLLPRLEKKDLTLIAIGKHLGKIISLGLLGGMGPAMMMRSFFNTSPGVDLGFFVVLVTSAIYEFFQGRYEATEHGKNFCISLIYGLMHAADEIAPAITAYYASKGIEWSPGGRTILYGVASISWAWFVLNEMSHNHQSKVKEVEQQGSDEEQQQQHGYSHGDNGKLHKHGHGHGGNNHHGHSHGEVQQYHPSSDPGVTPASTAMLVIPTLWLLSGFGTAIDAWTHKIAYANDDNKDFFRGVNIIATVIAGTFTFKLAVKLMRPQFDRYLNQVGCSPFSSRQQANP
jgi:hypothetical protein